jgi:hypothetical protein
VPIDRAATLRNAETLLQQGKIDQAIAESLRVVKHVAAAMGSEARVIAKYAGAPEAGGEAARALAICLELQADAGDHRNVAVRIDRLAKVQARG